MPTLFIRVLSEATFNDDTFTLGAEWLVAEDDGTVRGQGVTDYRGLADVADPDLQWLKVPQNIVVLVPAEHVLAVTCEVPGRNVGQIRRALPFAVEEFVATDIELMHIAHAPVTAAKPVRCNLLDLALLDGWLACFDSLGLKPGFMVGDAELLPADGKTVSVLFDGNSALVRSIDQSATVDRENLLFALSSLEMERLVTINGSLSELDVSQLPDEVTLELTGSDDGSVIGYLADRWRQNSARAINLLQGSYVPDQPQNTGMSRWSGVAALAGCWVLIAFVAMVVEGIWSDVRADSLSEDAYELYGEIFPGGRRPATLGQLRRSMQSRLGQGMDGQGGNFIALVAELATVMDANTEAMSIAYSDQRNDLTTEVQLKAYDDLERVKSSLGERGVNVDVASAEQLENGVRARLRLKVNQ